MAADKKKIQEIADLLDRIQKQYNALGEKNPFKGMDPNKVKDVDKTIKQLEVSLDGVESKARRINTTFGDLQGTLESITKEISQKQNTSVNKLTKGMKSLVSEARKLADEEVGINTLSKKQLEKIKERALSSQRMAKDNAAALLQEIGIRTKNGKVIEKDGLKMGRMNAEDREKAKAALGILQDQGGIQQDLIDKIQDRIGLEDKFNKKLGFGGQLAKGLDKALQKAGLPSIGIADAIEKARENFIKTNGESSVFKDTLKGVGKNLKGALSSANLMQMGFTLLIKSVMEVDKASGEFAKNNGISYQRALQIRGEMNEIARSSKDVLVNSKELMKTQSTLNEFFGQSVVFGDKLAEDMTSIARRTKMTSETQGVFALESMKTGKGAKDILKSQTLQVLEMNKQKGLHMSVKQVQDAIGKTSKALQLTFKGSTKELTKQVMQVKALGANLDTANSIASSLLDFESSIGAELNAELLLGKEINLEKARQFALQGDMGKMAKEVMKNEAIMEAFATKNVIAQEAAAKALGLNKDQLADMIMEQEKMEAIRATGAKDMNELQEQYNKNRAKGMSAEQAAANVKDKDLAAQLESVSAQEKLAETLQRVQELFVSMAEPILAIVTPIADIMVPAITMVSDIITYITDSVSGLIGIFTGANEQLSLMQTIVGSIAIAYGAVVAIQKVKQGYDTIALLMEKRKNKTQKRGLFGLISEMAMKAFNALGGIPVVGPVLGAAAAISAAALGYSYYNKAGDVMSPADGKTQISTKEGGLFELSPNDDLIAAPGAADMMTKKGEKNERGGGARRDAALIAKVEQLIGVNRQIITINQAILAKSPVIEMGGNEVGQGINTAEREIQ